MENQIIYNKPTKISKVTNIIRILFFCMNLLSLTGVLVLLIRPTPYLFGNMYGYVALLTLLGNMVLIYFGGKYRYLDYGYLLLHTLSMLFIPLMNTLASSDVHNKTSQSIVVFILYITIFISGAVISGLRVMGDYRARASDAEDIKQQEAGRAKNITRWIAVVLLWVCLLIGIILTYVMMASNSNWELFISSFAVFIGLFVLGVSLLKFKLRWRTKAIVFNRIVLSAGVIVCIVCFIPLASVPRIINNAYTAYREAFGGAYLDDRNLAETYGFMRHPFSMQNYLFGTRTRDFIIKENILFYEGTAGVDTGIRLHFDVYMPIVDSRENPAKNPVLIRIHGGGWTSGGKGLLNYPGINKHFVNLGYVVFDIQYGLADLNPLIPFGIPENVRGNFNIDDMVRHIGIFTTFLADHADAFNADINSVFISGGSAGGQLAVAVGLGITGGQHTDMLDSRLTVRGIIPYYPANGRAGRIGGSPELVDPVALVGENSPPILIFHGTHDGMVPPGISSVLLEAYEERSNAPGAVIWMNLAGHGSDFYTPGYYNQIFTYFMERFIRQFSAHSN